MSLVFMRLIRGDNIKFITAENSVESHINKFKNKLIKDMKYYLWLGLFI